MVKSIVEFVIAMYLIIEFSMLLFEILNPGEGIIEKSPMFRMVRWIWRQIAPPRIRPTCVGETRKVGYVDVSSNGKKFRKYGDWITVDGDNWTFKEW